jgi:hypothetical protein
VLLRNNGVMPATASTKASLAQGWSSSRLMFTLPQRVPFPPLIIIDALERAALYDLCATTHSPALSGDELNIGDKMKRLPLQTKETVRILFRILFGLYRNCNLQTITVCCDRSLRDAMTMISMVVPKTFLSRSKSS